MNASVVNQQGREVTLQVTIKFEDSMLASEEAIQQGVNKLGTVATALALEQFDTDGSPVFIGGTRWYSKGRLPKKYQTPYGETSVERHVYQRSGGGKTWCPLEERARVVCATSPRFVLIPIEF